MQKILVFDLGGGTFDVSVLVLDQVVFEVRSTGGNTDMGGRDFDNRLVNYFKEQIKKKLNIDVAKKPKSLMKLRNKCEFIKRQLSTCHEVLFEFDLGDEEYEESITRAKFENLCDDLFKECMDTMDQVI